MTSHFFNFKGIVSLCVDAATEAHVAPFMQRMANWHETLSTANQGATIQVKPLFGEIPAKVLSRQLDPSAPFLLMQHQGERDWVTFYYRTRPDMFLSLGETIEIHYVPRSGQEGKLYDLALFALQIALSRKNGLLFHGAVIKKGEISLVLTGPEDTKKTTLMLPLLRDGWDFVSDDLFILHDGQATHLSRKIPLKEHHFRFMPWLGEVAPGVGRFRRVAQRNRRILKWARQLPSYFFPLVNRFFSDPSLDVSVEELFPTIKVIDSVKITNLILLALGDEKETSDIEQTTAVARLGLIHRLLFPGFMILETMLSIDGHMDPIPYERILAENLASVEMLGFSLPVECEPDIAGLYLKEQVVPTLSRG